MESEWEVPLVIYKCVCIRYCALFSIIYTEMERRLMEAACSGDLRAVHDSVGEDAAILQKLLQPGAGTETPLHLASMFGHAEFVREYIKLGSVSVHQLSQLNGAGYSPFHLASANGHAEIVKLMLDIAREKGTAAERDLCLKMDKDGRTALHAATAAGKTDVIDVLLAVDYSKEAEIQARVNGDSVLHVAVKHHQHEALDLLIQKLGSSAKDLLNQGDREGNTLLHLATAQGQLQTVELLLKQPDLDVNAKNLYGLTALDIIFACGLTNSNNNNVAYLQEAIIRAGGCRASDPTLTRLTSSHPPATGPVAAGAMERLDTGFYYSKEVRGGIIVMASIVATVTFQVVLTPPGGLWQDWPENTNTTAFPHEHRPGHIVLYDLSRTEFTAVMVINLETFCVSIATILLSLQPVVSSVMDVVITQNMLPLFVPLTLILTVVDFLVILHITTTGPKSGLLRDANFLWPLVPSLLLLFLGLLVFNISTNRFLSNMYTQYVKKVSTMVAKCFGQVPTAGELLCGRAPAASEPVRA
ncbi:ankyrin repeat-containing protein BDA1-like [Andrographis paniculata]|uniref:ankyrin repeat-containing protein BDA1-like n=1 Tax=Andrographis paniculata TaxID=175694 RepID=UPI0021E9843F|nr:ankyrin repeat-containing protein BDA1-like [Andrographis paniculata]XP_051114823.1 ankyrin repeat-containing protein BDA1-like [Andrographis paniculata]